VSTGSSHVIAIDQGTTSTRAMIFDASRHPVAQSQKELRQIFPRQGWVEHDAEEIWAATVETVKTAMADADLKPADIVAIGITNQRETVVLWDRATGKPLHNAIVWQDRRTAAFCDDLRVKGVEDLVRARTGLLLDPYFSASKLTWLLENVDGAKERAARGDLAAGTIDSFLLWRLTGGKSFATDATNACRTMLFDIHRQCWDEELLDVFAVPKSLLPRIEDCAADFGQTDPALFDGAIRIGGIAGDQQAATVGQACFDPGAIKSTYGTGCFAVINTGDTPLASKNRLLTTVAYRLDGKPTYAVEGSIFIAGAAVQWLRDGLGIIKHAPETEALAKQAKADSAVYLVPAFTGLGAPYWDPGARGALFGMTRDTGPAELARATLEAVAYQTRDLFEAMESDGTALPATVRVDGGMTENAWFMQCLADTLGIAVERPPVTETTALGAAYLAGLQAGFYPGPEAMRNDWQAAARFEPAMPAAERDRRYAGWRNAVARTRSN
jgi:glycerol kinase